jgi:DHA2 family multidrug resistance protein-like MFS transporter
VGGMGLGNELMLGAIPVDRAGAAAAMNETVTELGGALGMAVLGSIGTAVYRHRMGGGVPAGARATLGGAVATAAHMPGAAGARLLATARDAFCSGINVVAFVGVGLLGAAALLSVLCLRHLRGQAEDPTPVAEPEPAAGALAA